MRRVALSGREDASRSDGEAALSGDGFEKPSAGAVAAGSSKRSAVWISRWISPSLTPWDRLVGKGPSEGAKRDIWFFFRYGGCGDGGLEIVFWVVMGKSARWEIGRLIIETVGKGSDIVDAVEKSHVIVGEVEGMSRQEASPVFCW